MLGAVGIHARRGCGIDRARARVQRVVAGLRVGVGAGVGRDHHAGYPRADQVVGEAHGGGVAVCVTHQVGDQVVGGPGQVDGRDGVARGVLHRLHREGDAVAAVHVGEGEVAAQQGLGPVGAHGAVGHGLGHLAGHLR